MFRKYSWPWNAALYVVKCELKKLNNKIKLQKQKYEWRGEINGVSDSVVQMTRVVV